MHKAKRHTELARALSKLGYCSRTQAARLILEGKVTLNQSVCLDPTTRVQLGHDHISVAGKTLEAADKQYLMLNKPRGIVTTTSDEQNRKTVYSLFEQHGLPWMSPVGRLDKASEGLLLFSNDTSWSAAITDPQTHIDKVYHVQIDRHLTTTELGMMQEGIVCPTGIQLSAKQVRLLRSGERYCWLEIILDEGRNRHIRRLLEAMQIKVLRLVRISIGPVQLGNLAKGAIRALSAEEISELRAIAARTLGSA